MPRGDRFMPLHAVSCAGNEARTHAARPLRVDRYGITLHPRTSACGPPLRRLLRPTVPSACGRAGAARANLLHHVIRFRHCACMQELRAKLRRERGAKVLDGLRGSERRLRDFGAGEPPAGRRTLDCGGGFNRLSCGPALRRAEAVGGDAATEVHDGHLRDRYTTVTRPLHDRYVTVPRKYTTDT